MIELLCDELFIDFEGDYFNCWAAWKIERGSFGVMGSGWMSGSVMMLMPNEGSASDGSGSVVLTWFARFC